MDGKSARVEQTTDVLVVGGGAAGFFGALEVKRLRPEWRVCILEAAGRPLSKVRISGGGRCNVTHACFALNQLVAHYPRGQKQLLSIFSRFGPRDTMDWFEERGVPLKIEADGRVFPQSDNSTSIVDCLGEQARRLGVEVHLNSRVQNLESGRVITAQAVWRSPRILLATGGAPTVYPWLSAVGHTVVPPVPSLFTFNVVDSRLQGLAGVSVSNVRGVLETTPPLRQDGALLVTHWGLSGPVILRLSAWGARALAALGYRCKLRLDLLPDCTEDELRQLFQARRRTSHKQVAGDCPVALPRRLWQSLAECQLPWSKCSDKELNRLVNRVKACSFEVTGKGVFKEEFVVAGGVPLAEVDLRTMESKCCPGLYLAGELLDVDGLTGGFNFQNAWATGYLAGQGMSRAPGTE